MMQLILAIDQGTTVHTVVLFDETFSVVSRGYAEVPPGIRARAGVETEIQLICGIPSWLPFVRRLRLPA
jgi:glycerol kinase